MLNLALTSSKGLKTRGFSLPLNGEPWFVASDVCRALEIGNPSMALSRLDSDEKGISLTDTPGGEQEMSIVNEPGLYALVLGSRKPEARAFKRWFELSTSYPHHKIYGSHALLDIGGNVNICQHTRLEIDG